MPRNRCCCFGLRGCALAVGIVFLLVSYAQLRYHLTQWSMADEAGVVYHRRFMSDDQALMYTGGAPRLYEEEKRLPGVEVMVLVTILLVVQLALDVILLHGVRVSPQDSALARSCLLAWVVFRAVFYGIASLSSFALLAAAVAFHNAGDERGSREFFEEFVMAVVVAGAFWCGWAVVAVFYRRLPADAAGGAIYGEAEMAKSPMGAPGGGEEPVGPGMA